MVSYYLWFQTCREGVIFKHSARAQRVLHPRAYIAPPRGTRFSPSPLHPLHQRPSTLPPLVSALSSFSSSGSVGCLSAPTHPGAPASAPIACSLAFFRKEHSVPFRSDIPGRPETQVGRWHAMRRTGKERAQGGEVELTEDVVWERIWRPRPEGNVVPPAL